MIRFILFFMFILFVHSVSSNAQNTCYRDSEGLEPNIDVSSVITVAGQSMDGPSGSESLFGPQTFLLEYCCEDEFLYVNGESAGGFFSNSRYMWAN